MINLKMIINSHLYVFSDFAYNIHKNRIDKKRNSIIYCKCLEILCVQHDKLNGFVNHFHAKYSDMGFPLVLNS